MNIPCKSYLGELPYVFISYSHKDTDIVYPIIEKLSNDDFRIWYDEGIEPGAKFAAKLYSKIKEANTLLVFISKNSMESRHVTNEIGIAFERKVNILPVLIDEDIELPEEVSYYLGSTQFFKNVDVDNIEESFLNIAATLPDIVQNSFVSKGDRLVSSKEYIQEAIIPNNIKIISKGVFKNAHSLVKIDLRNVENIEEQAFRNCSSLKEIVFSSKIKHIGESAFRDCTALETVKFVNTEIDQLNCGERCFENCTSLKTVNLPKSLGEIPSGMFNSCMGLEKIVLAEGVSILSESCFSSCSGLKEIVFPSTITKIDDMAFNACLSLKALDIPEGVTRFGKNVFRNCTNLESINLPKSLYKIINNPFKGCKKLSNLNVHSRNRYFKSENNILYNKNKSKIISVSQGVILETLNVLESVTEIGSGALYGCSSIKSINIPDTVTHIYEEAFSGCSNLKVLLIPESVIRIDDSCFKLCTNLETVTFENDCREIGWGVFNNCSKELIVKGQKGSFISKYCKKNKIAFEFIEDELS